MTGNMNDLLKRDQISEGDLKQAISQAVDIVRANVKEYATSFPANSTTDGFYKKTSNTDWTTGFFTGCIWLSYELTNEECFKELGEIQVDSFYDRVVNKIDINTHDMGFLYTLSCVAGYKLFGNQKAKEAAILAADHLASRYRTVGNFLQAWGNVDDPKEYRLIIDCLLNLPLLYWATQATGDMSYQEKAQNHIETAMKCLIRPDASTYHTYFFDPITGQPTKGVTCQGNRNDSAWARGQAWGIYGTALSYRYLRKKEYKEMFEKVTAYFLEHLPSDLIPYWDFDFNDGSDEPRDSSAAAIAACGMLEMAKYLEKEEAEKYTAIAKVLLKALYEKCANKDLTKSNGVLLHGVYARSTPWNPCKNRGVDECNLWGDYFYMEALTRLTENWEPYW